MVIYSLRRVFECRLVTFSVWVHLDKLVLASVLKVDPSWLSIACGGAVQGCTNVVEAGCLRTTFPCRYFCESPAVDFIRVIPIGSAKRPCFGSSQPYLDW